MQTRPISLVLADDDRDDRDFFKEILDDLQFAITLTTAKDGIELLNLLSAQESNLPDVLFLDLNMPRKNGFECLEEIKSNAKLKSLPVVIFSTSYEVDAINKLHGYGAHYYIRKPAEFSKLKCLIKLALLHIIPVDVSTKSRAEFELSC